MESGISCLPTFKAGAWEEVGRPTMPQWSASHTSVCIRITWKACYNPDVSDSVGLGCGSRICIPNPLQVMWVLLWRLTGTVWSVHGLKSDLALNLAVSLTGCATLSKLLASLISHVDDDNEPYPICCCAGFRWDNTCKARSKRQTMSKHGFIFPSQLHAGQRRKLRISAFWRVVAGSELPDLRQELS